MTTLAPPPSLHRVRIFVDFWNFTLSMNAKKPKFQPDWTKIGRLLAAKAAEQVDPSTGHSFEAMHVYGSFDPASPADLKLRQWLEGWLDKQPGVHVSSVPRQKKKSPPKCPSCHAETATCSACGSDMRGTEEKGVDTRIVTDMMSHAWADGYKVALLISADRDFIPIAEELQKRGIKVIHGQFGSTGMDLSKKCWGRIDLAALMPQFER
ncbi:NYN domain-containing protein [Tabrizicola sp.]|uniref:NYN domain-containing protein n=1 Tax=Tabrizicola sp. TaxID=2005166 RepID=UPI0025F7A940|nr:NYN domain-containing protein [Tabrizicola sp.]MBY0349457.1 NYN domain-containing protein [Tabrizicola sp.]